MLVRFDYQCTPHIQVVVHSGPQALVSSTLVSLLDITLHFASVDSIRAKTKHFRKHNGVVLDYTSTLLKHTSIKLG